MLFTSVKAVSAEQTVTRAPSSTGRVRVMSSAYLVIKLSLKNWLYVINHNTEKDWPQHSTLPGRNKHSKALIGIMYRSKLILSESDWLERVESLLGYLTMSWDGLLVVTGDVNIDMRKPSDNLTRKYQTLLEAFSLKQIVTKPTRVT